MEFGFLINPCDLAFFIHTNPFLFSKRCLSFGRSKFQDKSAMPERSPPRYSVNGKPSCSTIRKRPDYPVYPLRFFSASGLFEIIIPTV